MNYDEKAAEVCKVVGRYCPESLGYDRDHAAIAAALREAAAEAYEDAAKQVIGYAEPSRSVESNALLTAARFAILDSAAALRGPR